MTALATVLVVRELKPATDTCAIVALCSEHTRMLKAARWARIEEVVGFSSLMQCEACALIGDHAHPASALETSDATHVRYPRLLDRDEMSPSCA
jgi:hypothetical protein